MYGSLTLAVVVLLAVSLPSEVRGGEKYMDKKGAHSIAMGSRKMKLNKPVDTHIYHESIKTDGTLLQVKEHDICYPNKKSKQSKFTITSFIINDVGKKGLAWVKKGGGVGKHNVCFHVKSERGSGYHFDIDIYGTFD